VSRDQLAAQPGTALDSRLTSSGAGVEVVVGKAGTGKTYALDAARHAWNAARIPVTGVALAARAALELEQSAGIRSSTLTSLLGRLDQGLTGALPPGSVLVIDEAGMVGTRQLARLLHHASEREVKVVLVGDPHQLPEIDAGGLFRALATRLPAIELTDNRRQQHAWEQTALDQLRHGDAAVALDTYRAHGRIVTAEDPQALREQLIDDWWTTARTDAAGSIMIGLRRSDVDDLNHGPAPACTPSVASPAPPSPPAAAGSSCKPATGSCVYETANVTAWSTAPAPPSAPSMRAAGRSA
jgi:ATP-dependent exoDNAse (exonuclease V) alpha subunit